MERELRRRRWIVKRKIDGWTNSAIANHLGISERTVIRWHNTYKQYGLNGLEIKSRKPNTIHRTLPEVVDKVLQIRKETNYGPHKIREVLKRSNVSISHDTVYRILVKHGLNNPLNQPRKTWGRGRFQREHSNSLWQTDFKMTDDDRWMVTFLDDHSRFVIGCKINEDATSDNVIGLLGRTITAFGAPKQILSDRGTQFYSDDEGSISRFTGYCSSKGIEHIVASKRRPTTIGKVERWHRTYDDEHSRFKTLNDFVRYYNYKRLHQSLGYLTPSEVYFRDIVTDVVR